MDNWNRRKRRVNPRDEANIFSLFTFCYTLPIFRKGLRKDLEEDDLYEAVKSCRSKKCGDKTEEVWNKYRSFYMVLWKRFGVEYIILSLVNVAWVQIDSVLHPHGMSRLISYFEENQTKISKTDAYYSAGLVVFLNVFSFVFYQNLFIFEETFGRKIQTSLRSLFYRKILKLSPASDTNMGNLITIITKDICILENNLWMALDSTTLAVKIVTVSYLLWYKLGNPAFIGIGLLFVAFPLQIYLGTLLTKVRLNVGKNSDERLQIMQETLSAMKIIKMYTWEKFFHKKISDSRSQEMFTMIKAFYVHYVIAALGVITSKLTFLLLIMSYIWMGYTTNTELLFYVLSLYHNLSFALAVSVPVNISYVADLKASFIRFNKLLQMEEVKKTEEENENGKPSIELEHVIVDVRGSQILRNVSLTMKEPGLTLVTGAVGTGKTSLLKTILKDYNVLEGKLEVHGTISYASQEPWLFPSSIKQNILFGEKYEASRYEEVIRVCALKYDLSLLENGDETLVADRGINLSKGQQSRINLARAAYRNTDMYLLDDSLTALDGHVQDFIFRECIKKLLSDKICILVTQNAVHIEEADNVIVMDHGRIVFQGKPEDVTKKINGLNGICTNKDIEIDADQKNEKHFLLETEQQYCKKKVYYEQKKTGKVDWAIYKQYFKFGGGYLFISFVVFLYAIAQTCDSFSDKLITHWIDLQQKVLDLKTNSTVNETYYEETVTKKDDTFSVYAIMIILKSVMGLIKYYALLRFCRSASINMHQAMLSRIVKAVMSFFDSHFIGNILNRFSLDLNNIDESLPFVLPTLIGTALSCVGGIVLVTTVNSLFLIPACVFLVVMVVLRMIYIPTGRSLKRLEASTRSPLVGHINASLEGLTTIRAFKAEQILKDEYDRHQDLNMSANFTFFYTILAFGFFMDFCSSIFTMLVIGRFLFFEHDLSAGNVGLALIQVLSLTHHVEWGIRQWAIFESYMTSVERALEYTTIEEEKGTGNEVKNWPSGGRIKYENVTLRYESAKDPVLKGISFSVSPRQKIGIVGRTGAGKSSIISTLFRLYDYEGKILLDDVDVKSLTLTFLRKNIAIIPQDPILFTGTIRSNIDPNEEHPDEKIWKAIEQVKIKHLIPNLDMPIKENGLNFSVGQKQLICLARASTAKYKVVVLDEATANMDPVMDKMLLDVIDDIFSNCTIITIAHRLHSVLNCDKVMVMDSGEIVEFDNPNKLLENKDSSFYKMCHETEKEA